MKLNNLQKAGLAFEALATIALPGTAVNNPSISNSSGVAESVQVVYSDPVPSKEDGFPNFDVTDRFKQEDKGVVLEQYNTLFEVSPMLKDTLVGIGFEKFSTLSERRRELVLDLARANILPFLRSETGGSLSLEDLTDLEIVFEAQRITPATNETNLIVLRTGTRVSEQELPMQTAIGTSSNPVVTVAKNGVAFSFATTPNNYSPNTVKREFDAGGHVLSVEVHPNFTSLVVQDGEGGVKLHEDLANLQLLERKDFGSTQAYMLDIIFNGSYSTEDAQKSERFLSEAIMFLDGEGIVLSTDSYTLDIIHADDGLSAFVLTNKVNKEPIVIGSHYLRRDEMERFRNAPAFHLQGRHNSDRPVVLSILSMQSGTGERHGQFGYLTFDAETYAQLRATQEAVEAHPSLNMLNLLGFNVANVRNPELQDAFIHAFEQNAQNVTDPDRAVELSPSDFVFGYDNNVFTVTGDAGGTPVTVHFFPKRPIDDLDLSKILAVRIELDDVIVLTENPDSPNGFRYNYLDNEVTTITAGDGIVSISMPE